MLHSDLRIPVSHAARYPTRHGTPPRIAGRDTHVRVECRARRIYQCGTHAVCGGTRRVFCCTRSLGVGVDACARVCARTCVCAFMRVRTCADCCARRMLTCATQTSASARSGCFRSLRPGACAGVAASALTTNSLARWPPVCLIPSPLPSAIHIALPCPRPVVSAHIFASALTIALVGSRAARSDGYGYSRRCACSLWGRITGGGTPSVRTTAAPCGMTRQRPDISL